MLCDNNFTQFPQDATGIVIMHKWNAVEILIVRFLIYNYPIYVFFYLAINFKVQKIILMYANSSFSAKWLDNNARKTCYQILCRYHIIRIFLLFEVFSNTNKKLTYKIFSIWQTDLLKTSQENCIINPNY